MKMNRKLMTAMLIPFMLMLAVAFGYAAWTSSITESITATAGTINVQFVNSGSWYINGPPYVTVDFTGTTGSTLVASVSNFEPGDSVTIYFQIQNTGSLPVSSIASSYPLPHTQGDFTYSDTVTGALDVGQALWYTATITASASLTQGESTVFSVTLTAST
jgi:uncharacterized membrane protein